jgi:hypothetical protein
MSGQFGLLKQKRFAPFFATQFLGAFNDNLFKNALVVLLTFQAAQLDDAGKAGAAGQSGGRHLHPALLPVLGDRRATGRQVRQGDAGPPGQGAGNGHHGRVAAAGFWLHSLPVLMGALFLLGCHSTLFGPVKYAILPQHLHEDELVGGNALIEAGTFVAILIGTLAGGLLAGSVGIRLDRRRRLLVADCRLPDQPRHPAAPAPAPELKVNLNPFTETWRNIALPGKPHGLSCPFSASRGSGSTARCSSPSSRPTPRTCWAAASPR